MRTPTRYETVARVDITNARKCSECSRAIEPHQADEVGHLIAYLAGFCSMSCAGVNAVKKVAAGKAWWQRQVVCPSCQGPAIQSKLVPGWTCASCGAVFQPRTPLTAAGVGAVVAAAAYPANWPACPACGLPALDGKATCGNVTCGSAVADLVALIASGRQLHTCECCARLRLVDELGVCGGCGGRVCVQPNPDLCIDEGDGAPWCASRGRGGVLCVDCLRVGDA